MPLACTFSIPIDFTGSLADFDNNHGKVMFALICWFDINQLCV